MGAATGSASTRSRPGVIETEILTENIERGVLDPATFDARIPIGRMGGRRRSPRPSSSSPTRATYITGQMIVVDGGFTVSFAW